MTTRKSRKRSKTRNEHSSKRKRPLTKQEIERVADIATFHLALLDKPQIISMVLKGQRNEGLRESLVEDIRSAAGIAYFDWDMLQFSLKLDVKTIPPLRRALKVERVLEDWSKELWERRPSRGEIVRWVAFTSAGKTVPSLWYSEHDAAWVLSHALLAVHEDEMHEWFKELGEPHETELILQRSDKGLRHVARCYAAKVLGLDERTVRRHLTKLTQLRSRRLTARQREGIV